MPHLDPLLLIIASAPLVLTGIGRVGGWYNEEARRIRRGLRKVLKGNADALIVAHGQGRGAALNFATGMLAVAWDAGEWCLIYRIDELVGLELVVDGQVAPLTCTHEHWPREAPAHAREQISLRLIFNDPRHADFVLELWNSQRRDSAQALDEAARWLARVAPLLRRKPPRTPLRLATYRTSLSVRFAWPSAPPRLAVPSTPGIGEG
jgi:hypothetical protein